MKPQKKIAAFSIAAGLLGGGLAGVALGVPGLAGAQEDQTTTTQSDPATPATPATPADPAAKPDKGQWVDDALKPLVDNGTLTQAQADAVADALEAARPARGGHGPGGHGGPMGFRGAKLDAAATALGMTVEELRTALEGGKSLADVANDKGVAVSKVVDALVAEAKAKLAEGVSSGRITQAQADQMTADLQARIESFVNRVGPAGGPGFGHGHGRRGFDGPPPADGSGATSSGSTQSSDGSQPA